MNENSQSIVKSALGVALMMLAFKFLGFIKQAVIAYVFGANSQTDTYFIAWGFVSGISEALVNALLVSLIATYTSLIVNQGRNEASKLINGILEILVPGSFIIIGIVIVLAPLISNVLAPSYQGEDKTLLVHFIRVLSPILFFSCFELVFRAVLDSNKCYFISRLQSLIYSISVIASCLLLYNYMGIKALFFAQYVSSFIFSIVLIITVYRYHKFFVLKYAEIPNIRRLLMTALPLFIGNSAIQINQIVDKSITSGIANGATSALSYCHIIEQLVTNVLIVNVGNIMFANYTELVSKKQFKMIEDNLTFVMNILIVALLGISVITIIFSKEIVSLIYYRGNFSYDAVLMVSIALIGYSISFVAVAVRDLAIKSLYAFSDTYHPMIASMVSIGLNIIFSIGLSKYMGIFGVSIATSISVFVGMILNTRFLKKYLTNYRYAKNIVVFVKSLPGAIFLALISLFIKNYVPSNENLIKLILAVILGVPVYFVFLYCFQVDEVKKIIWNIKLKWEKRKSI